MSTETKACIDEYTTTLIRLKAYRLVGRYGFRETDAEDIEQELTLAVLVRLDQFDPQRGKFATFVRMVVEREIVGLIRKRTTLQRDYRRGRHSLDEIRDDSGNTNTAEPRYDDQVQRDLGLDLAEALGELPGDLRAIAAELADAPLTQVARAHRCSRENMRRKAEQIREHLARRGLDLYIRAHRNGETSRM